MKKKSLKLNAILNGIKTLLSIIFPILTFPYASRILQVENLGKVNFSLSVISYLSLIAALGISTYAIREGGRLRNNPKEFNKFANQIFTINILSTILSYFVLFILLLSVPQLQEYKLLLLIQSLVIVLTTIGVDWIYSIYEDYFYITVRSLLTQIVSLILLFSLVKSKEDYYLYALVYILSSAGSNIYNFIRSKRYCKLQLTTELDLKKHIKPIVIIFSTNIAAAIYLNSDMTMLGILVGTYNVGLYSVSVKLYTIVKLLLVTIIIVALPRLSYYISENKKDDFNNTLQKILSCLILLVFPIAVGINILSHDIILFISGTNYSSATTSLRILSFALIFSTMASFITTSILLPLKKEGYIMRATIVSALGNIVLNFLFIPKLQQDGAAITTVISEALVFLIALIYARKLVNLRSIGKTILTSIIGCVVVIVTSMILQQLVLDRVFYLIVTIALSCTIYFLILLFQKNQLVFELTDSLRNKIIK